MVCWNTSVTSNQKNLKKQRANKCLVLKKPPNPNNWLHSQKLTTKTAPQEVNKPQKLRSWEDLKCLSHFFFPKCIVYLQWDKKQASFMVWVKPHTNDFEKKKKIIHSNGWELSLSWNNNSNLQSTKSIVIIYKIVYMQCIQESA